MVEHMMMFGKAAHELWDYNRDVFKFDNMQILQRDLLRLEMQVKRFELFREDIRDLVELTVGKMEMYHLVGALFLEFCIALYVEGKIETTENPFFSIALYYLSIAGAFLYLVLAVWLSMHASISSQSFGVRLLTRYVRLPIPSAEQFKMINPVLADYERQGVNNALRVPGLQQAPEWRPRTGGSSASSSGTQVGCKPGSIPDYLGSGEMPYSAGEKGVLRAAPSKHFSGLDVDFGGGGQHVTVFRRLQAYWQSYDAYARVSMSLGANMILLSITFYMINVTVVEYRSLTACWALIFVFQAASLALVVLDIAGMGRRALFLMQVVGSSPPLVAAIGLTYEVDRGQIDLHSKFPWSPLCFFCMVLWFECLLWMAWPSEDEATLPRRFRSVLFLDVFGDIPCDPVDAEQDSSVAWKIGSRRKKKDVKVASASSENLTAADDACDLAHQALRRWEAVPFSDHVEMKASMIAVRDQRRKFIVWQKALANEIAQRAKKQGSNARLFHDDKYYIKAHQDLNDEEQRLDAFGGVRPRIVGPIQVQRPGALPEHFYFSVEAKRFIAQAQLAHFGEPLTMEQLTMLCAAAENAVRHAIGSKKSDDAQARIDSASEDSADSDDEDDSLSASEGKWCLCCHRKPEAPQNLPWWSLKLGTRCMQVAWAAQGIVFLGQENGFWQVDYPRKRAKAINEQGDTRRLLQQYDPWRFEALEVKWHDGEYFQPNGPFRCLPAGVVAQMFNSTGEMELPAFVMSRARNSYVVRPTSSIGEPSVLSWRPSLSTAVVPHEAVAMCGPDVANGASAASGSGCVLALARQDNTIAFWPLGTTESASAVRLRVESRRPWLSIAGAKVPCARVARMLVDQLDHTSGGGGPSQSLARWCLFLVGWDGGHELSAAALTLNYEMDVLPSPGLTIVPVFSLPLHVNFQCPRFASADDSRQLGFDSGESRLHAPAVKALHMDSETGRGRLWALLVDGTLLAWEAATDTPRSLGHWNVQWPTSTQFKADSIVEAANAAKGAAPVSTSHFRATSMCEATAPFKISVPSGTNNDSRRHLFVIGYDSLGAAQLLQAALPVHIDGAIDGDLLH